jgi:N-acetylglucosaminyl-diphospho-decaprenol L-rhamnosyltransferase
VTAGPADVEVSVVSLGATELLAAGLRTLPRACAGLSWRLTVVDNSPAGRDLSAPLAGLPSAATIRSVGRRGFGANHNLVLSGVLAEKRARYVLVLNDDTELDAGAVAALVRHADRRPDVGALCPLIRDDRGRPEPSRLPWPSVTQQALGTMFPGRPTADPARGGWLNGACILLRTAALGRVGLFDPAFFLFFEDTDLCRRLAGAGWELDVCEEAGIVHHRHGTILAPELRRAVEEQMLRSRYLYFRKHHGPAAARAATVLVRGALLARAAKMLAEARAGRRASTGFAQPRTLWALARSRPARPSRLELEARGQPGA